MKLTELMAGFDGLDDEEKLELLVDLSGELPPLSPERAGRPPSDACRVKECQTPIFLWVEVIDGRTRLEADVPKQSPTVRGLVALMVQGLDGASPAEVAAIPDDMVGHLGLQRALGMTRQRGFRGVVDRIKREILLQPVTSKVVAP